MRNSYGQSTGAMSGTYTNNASNSCDGNRPCSPSGPVRQTEGFCGGRISGSS
ncbi:hypothetical protein HAP48_0026535 [Bradyrhizobium septentrionale]|nr:hypothetical protein HAP48_0026535 [Bradyrhizobium septentrionale]UGY29416.1 hypothetical protein HU675_0001575 [Bradyrhizobium septentrionale]